MNIPRRTFGTSLAAVHRRDGVPGSVSARRQRAAGAGVGTGPGADEGDQDPAVLSAQLRRQRPAGLPAEQHGRAGRYRRRHHRHRPGRLAGHGAQRRAQRHRQERVRHRDDLAGRVHGRVLLAGQGAAARASAPSTWRCGTSRARRSACRSTSSSAARPVSTSSSTPPRACRRARPARRGAGDEPQGARGGHHGRRLPGLPRRRRHPADAPGARDAGSRGAAAAAARRRPSRWSDGGAAARLVQFASRIRRSSTPSSRSATASAPTATG